MKKALAGILILSLICCTGCSTTKKNKNNEEKRIKLVWQSEQRFWEHQDYFNQVLKEKGYPYEVEFVTSETVQKNQTVDLLETGMTTWAEPYDTNKDALEGRLLPLDDYLNTTEGKKIKDAVPQKIWDSHKVNGKQYSVLSPGFLLDKIAYIWDTTLAEKYDVHPENWDVDLWKHKEELLKIAEGEKNAGRKNFSTVSNLFSYTKAIPETTFAIGLCYPIIFRENTEEVRAEFLFDTPEYKRNLAGMRDFYHAGLWKPEVEGERKIDCFLTTETNFWTKNAYLGFREPDFWDTHEVKEFDTATVWELSAGTQETGITTESKHPDEAFDLLCALYTDKDLVNAIEWGAEDNYEVVDGKAVQPVTKEYLQRQFAGNQFLGYVGKNEDNNLKEIYPKEIDRAKVSKTIGFHFHGENIKENLKKMEGLDSEAYDGYGVGAVKNMEQIIKKYKQAGIDKVIAEWNRQFAEWEKESR